MNLLGLKEEHLLVAVLMALLWKCQVTLIHSFPCFDSALLCSDVNQDLTPWSLPHEGRSPVRSVLVKPGSSALLQGDEPPAREIQAILLLFFGLF